MRVGGGRWREKKVGETGRWRGGEGVKAGCQGEGRNGDPGKPGLRGAQQWKLILFVVLVLVIVLVLEEGCPLKTRKCAKAKEALRRAQGLLPLSGI